MQSEVFRPSTSSLLVRGAISEGPNMSMNMFRKEDTDTRPSTQGGYRFGQLSHNSFFARHNPHPGRVRHIKGLLDVPICSVNDDGYFANPRYALRFPPNSFNQMKISQNGQGSPAEGATKFLMPVNAINVTSKTHPINSITGLQNFLGKPMNFRVFKEKAVPRIGMVPKTDAWRDELKALTEAAGLAQGKQLAQPGLRPPMEQGRPRTTQYSTETGRLIPPPSRAMSRGPSRACSRAGLGNQFQHISEEPDQENMILQMLCQILQTDDVNAVQSWLVSAGDREKALVLAMIKSALNNIDEDYRKDASEHVPEERPCTTLPGLLLVNNLADKMLGASDKGDRLTLDGGALTLQSPIVGMNPFQDPIMEEDMARNVLPNVFRRPGMGTSGRQVAPLSRPHTPVANSYEATLHYTMTPGPTTVLDEDKVWQPDISV